MPRHRFRVALPAVAHPAVPVPAVPLLAVLLLAILVAACAAAGSPLPTPARAPSGIATAAPATTLGVIRTSGNSDAPASISPTLQPATVAPAVSPVPALSPAPATPALWSLAVVGDSIPFNNPKDCPGCTGVAARYAAAIEGATGREVMLTNLSEYTGLRVEGLLAELRSDTARRRAIAGADVVLITIAHNNVVCPDWDLDRATCATLAEQYRGTYAQVFAAVVALRAGRATAFRTINRYNDVTGPGTTDGEAAGSKLILDAWNEMVCGEATAHGFLCADLYHAFNGPDGLTPSGDLLAKDYTHPSDLGNERITDVLAALAYGPLGP